MHTILQGAIEALRNINNVTDFQSYISRLKQDFQNAGVQREIIQAITNNAYYMENQFSSIGQNENMMQARERTISYLENLLIGDENSLANDKTIQLVYLRRILENFPVFVESLFEKSPNQKAAIRKETLEQCKISNEYDVQHLLYAVIKLLFPCARMEVNQDMGVRTVRSDIWIEELSADIEVKCSRNSMTLRSLTEEIAADIVHYQGENIFFFIYDKNKIIENSAVFIKNYQKTFEGKRIFVVIHQPKFL